MFRMETKSMKILMIDTDLEGHHIAYLNEIINGCDAEFTLVLPKTIEAFSGSRIITYSPIDLNKKKFIPFIHWMKELSEIAEKEQPDIIHFLMGDVFYKYFGTGLSLFKKYKTVMTLHWIRPGKLQHISLFSFCKKVDTVVVHSSYLLAELQKLDVHNGVHIEYPQFKRPSNIQVDEAKQYWKLSPGKPVVLALGSTRPDKGVDILINALNNVHRPFQLLIAGKPEEFDEVYIKEHTQKYASQVVTALRYLTDKEVELAVVAADIIVLPYKYSFNGASGPLGEGVCQEKCIIGSGHGNLGATIQDNHLGYVFQTENSDDLARVIDDALEKQPFYPDSKYRTYKSSLNPALFVKSYNNLYKNM